MNVNTVETINHNQEDITPRLHYIAHTNIMTTEVYGDSRHTGRPTDSAAAAASAEA